MEVTTFTRKQGSETLESLVSKATLKVQSKRLQTAPLPRGGENSLTRTDSDIVDVSRLNQYEEEMIDSGGIGDTFSPGVLSRGVNATVRTAKQQAPSLDRRKHLSREARLLMEQKTPSPRVYTLFHFLLGFPTGTRKIIRSFSLLIVQVGPLVTQQGKPDV